MNFEDLSSILKANGLNVIRIRGFSPDDSMLIDGELEDFINATKVLKENTAFVDVLKLKEEDFYYDFDDSNDSMLDSIYVELRNASPFDFSKILPEIRSYKKYLNTEGVFELSIFYKNHILKYCQAEKWWLQFQEIREEAIGEIIGQERLRQEKMEEEHSQRDQELLGKLNKLIEDGNFLRIFTQKDATKRAMVSYAMEAIPELQELSSQAFYYGIDQLMDKVRAKKALKK